MKGNDWRESLSCAHFICRIQLNTDFLLTWTISMRKNNHFYCRVCGYESDTAPWGADGKTPVFNFCPCCGVEHGYQDSHPIGARNYRDKWINSGARWEEQGCKPRGWVLEDQLRHIQAEFL